MEIGNLNWKLINYFIFTETYCFDRATGRCGCPALRLLLKVDGKGWIVIISKVLMVWSVISMNDQNGRLTSEILRQNKTVMQTGEIFLWVSEISNQHTRFFLLIFIVTFQFTICFKLYNIDWNMDIFKSPNIFLTKIWYWSTFNK